jgi:hypothetical protein
MPKADLQARTPTAPVYHWEHIPTGASDVMMRFLIPTVLLLLTLGLASTPGSAQPNFVEKNSYEHAVFVVELISPAGQLETFVVDGGVEIEVSFEGPIIGAARDNDGNGLDEVSAEIVGMNLVGSSPTYGPVRLILDSAGPSIGILEERQNDILAVLDLPPYASSGQADSFFDVLFQIEFGGVSFFTVTPDRIRGILTRNPAAAGDILTGSGLSTLYDQNGNPTGWILRIVTVQLSAPVEIDRFESATAELELMDPTGAIHIVPLNGSSTVESIFEGAVMGSADDDDLDGLDEIDSELVALSLTGSSLTLGRVTLVERPGLASVGRLEENLNLTPDWLDLAPFTPGGTAQSSFDVFLTVDIGGEQLTTASSHRIVGTVTYKPAAPGDEFVGEGSVQLMDSAGAPTGWWFRIRGLWLGNIATAVGDGGVPSASPLSLHAAPNPFNPRVRVYFQAELAGPISLRVFDLRGRPVATLYEGSVGVGEQSWVWDGQGTAGRVVASGVYLLRLESPEGTTHRKISLVR